MLNTEIFILSLFLPAIDESDSSMCHWPMTDVSTQKIPESHMSQLGVPQRSAQICSRVAILKIKSAVKICTDCGIQGRSRKCHRFLGKACGVGFWGSPGCLPEDAHANTNTHTHTDLWHYTALRWLAEVVGLDRHVGDRQTHSRHVSGTTGRKELTSWRTPFWVRTQAHTNTAELLTSVATISWPVVSSTFVPLSLLTPPQTKKIKD